MSRPYTGTKDGVAKRKRPGTEAFYAGVIELMDGELKGLGTYVIRNKRGKQELSVHATARGMNLGYSKRTVATTFMNALIECQEQCQLEACFDYFYKDPRADRRWGRGWMCTREAWQGYTKRTINPAGLMLIHIELAPQIADSPELARRAVAAIKATLYPAG